MRKLFTGRFHRIPIAVLSVVLLGVLVTGGVVAAVSGGYVLWQASSSVTVPEPIQIHYGPDASNCNTDLVPNVDPTLGATIGLYPGMCLTTCFNITNASSYPLLVKAVVTTSNSSVVTVTFNATNILTTGINVTSSSPLFVTRTVCVSGTATPGLYTVSTGFTRESPSP